MKIFSVSRANQGDSILEFNNVQSLYQINQPFSSEVKYRELYVSSETVNIKTGCQVQLCAAKREEFK
jgi:hypothetical protein